MIVDTLQTDRSTHPSHSDNAARMVLTKIQLFKDIQKHQSGFKFQFMH